MSTKPASNTAVPMKADIRPSAVIPLRYVESVDAVRRQYLEEFGFEHMMGMVGGDGQFDFAIVLREGAMLMLARPTDPGAITRGPLEIYVEVQDVDAYHAELARRGVAISKPITTQWWGDRNFAVTDKAGHLIWFWKTVAEPSPPPGVTMI